MKHKTTKEYWTQSARKYRERMKAKGYGSLTISVPLQHRTYLRKVIEDKIKELTTLTN